jgi:hypothetical protein
MTKHLYTDAPNFEENTRSMHFRSRYATQGKKKDYAIETMTETKWETRFSDSAANCDANGHEIRLARSIKRRSCARK